MLSIFKKTNKKAAEEVSYNILQNAVQIGDDILLSNHCHDYVVHEKTGLAIDGGREYQRWVGDFKKHKVVDLTVTDNMPLDEQIQKTLWGTRGVDGLGELKWVFLKDCTSAHLAAILKSQKKASPHIRRVIGAILYDRMKQTIDVTDRANVFLRQDFCVKIGEAMS